jgi:RNA polymerase sigma-70 factor (ECF subfamily)
MLDGDSVKVGWWISGISNQQNGLPRNPQLEFSAKTSPQRGRTKFLEEIQFNCQAFCVFTTMGAALRLSRTLHAKVALMIAFNSQYRDYDADPDTARMIRVSQGDERAFDELVARNFASTVRVIASMLGGSSTAEDLAQDAFLRVYRSRHRYLPTAKFSTFLGTIIRNTVLNEKRRLSRQRVSFTQFADRGSIGANDASGIAEAPCYEVDFARRLDFEQAKIRLNRAIVNLPSRQRRAVELVYLQGLSYVKAAEEMATSRKAVKSLLGRGRQSLLESLSETSV